MPTTPIDARCEREPPVWRDRAIRRTAIAGRWCAIRSETCTSSPISDAADRNLASAPCGCPGRPVLPLPSPAVRSLKRHLITSVDMARFVATGIVRLDGVVPDELNRRVLAQLDAGLSPFPYGTPLTDVHPAGTALGTVLRLPVVAGAIQSLVGPDPDADHQYI